MTRYTLTPSEVLELDRINKAWQPSPGDKDYQKWLDDLREQGQIESDKRAMMIRENSYD